MPAPRSHRSRTLTALAVSLLLAAGTVGCSSDSDGAPGTSTTTTEAPDDTTTAPDDDGATTTAPEDDGDPTTTVPDEDGDDEPSVSIDDVSDEERPYVEAVVETLSGAPVFGMRDTACLAIGFVQAVGVDRITEAGLSPEEFSETGLADFPDELEADEDLANAVYDVYEDCEVDLRAAFKDTAAASADPLTPDQESCIDDLLSDDRIRESFVAESLGRDLDPDPFDEAAACITGNAPDD